MKKELEIYAEEQGETVSDGRYSKKKKKKFQNEIEQGVEVRNKKQ